jgi:uncharacterized membrane protein YgcG
MVTLAVSVPVTLSALNPVFRTPPVPLGALTAAITVTLQRPTTARPLRWDSTGRLRVSLVMVVDGVEYRATGQTSGGIRLDRSGNEASEYVLTFVPTVLLGDTARTYLRTAVKDAEGFYNDVPLSRLGETGSVIEGYLLLEWLSGTIETVVTAAVTGEAPAPRIRWKNSVAFDAATSANEVNGDGILSLTHTASGTNRGVFAGGGNSSGGGGRLSTSCTYAGNAMTEQWDFVASPFYGNAGYVLAGDTNIPTGAQTVTQTLAAGPDEHGLGVISMTGVNGTTPAGTPATASGSSTAASVTVTDAGADDLIVDNLYVDGVVPTVGADQTQRYAQDAIGGFNYLRGSTQPGSAGGVMSWSFSSTAPWLLGAVTIKAATAGLAGPLVGSRLLGVKGLVS